MKKQNTFLLLLSLIFLSNISIAQNTKFETLKPKTVFHNMQLNIVNHASETEETGLRLKNRVKLEYSLEDLMEKDSTVYNWSGNYENYNIVKNDIYENYNDYLKWVESDFVDSDFTKSYFYKIPNETFYSLDAETNEIQYSYKIEVSLNSEGFLLESLILFWNGFEFEEAYKESCEYDSNNNLTEYVTSFFDDSENQWIFESKTTISYDNNGNIIEMKVENFSNEENTWEIEEITNFEFDQNGNLIREESKRTQAGILVDEYKKQFEYSEENLLISMTQQGGQPRKSLENYRKEEYSYNSEKQMTELLISYWFTTDWEIRRKYTFAYDNNKLSQVLYYTIVEGDWFNDFKQDFNYNTNNNLSSVEEKNLETTNENISKLYIEYNEYQQVSEIGKIKFNIFSSISDKIIYTYEEIDETKISNLIFSDFTVFPNPAQNFINIQSAENLFDKVELIDITGKTVFVSKIALNSNNISIPTSHLANGNYQLKVTSGNQIGTKQIIVNK
ncbi:MAG: T9SS type A sorting domain-containing protein [Bacteroidales bacterium]|jgi:hypothetical protein|nr:T9SS type A sorting domain-containing protein [Bacteroidales bacterium]MCK9498837.1 T9SS type A sorting domain-containing protein [Bacteroidales bacterium]NLB85865.1 T9SS type A sorting domain-containing protein [Bacteroidales bacterium]